MQYFSIVQRFQSSNNLNKNVPNLLFFDISFSLLVAAYFLKHIAIVGVLHNETRKQGVSGEEWGSDLPQTTTWLVNEGLLVGNDIIVVDAREYAHFIQSIFLFFVW